MKKEALTFVVFGGTGDLAKRKLAPAFSELIHDGILKKGSTLIGISRKKMSDDKYKELLVENVKDVKEKHHLEDVNIRYLSIDFSKADNLHILADALPSCEISGCNRVYYLATSYKLFPEILEGLRKFSLLSKKDKYNKVVFEKPFGEDLKSSDALEKKIHEIVNEKHIFRIDHYLGKESVQNILRLKNNLEVSKLMNSGDVESVEIIVDEKLGVGNRLGYYNDFGALKDMVQNHLLQLLALVLMDKPKKIEAEHVHNEKVKILKKISFSNTKESLLGQYESYEKELGRKSKTETFCKIVLSCSGKKYKGVKIILRTGKKLPKKYGQIRIGFKDNKSEIVINLQPEQNIDLLIKGKKIDGKNVCIDCDFSPNTKDAYENLIKDIINDDKRLFVRNDEIHEAWRIIDSIENIKDKIRFVIYGDCRNPE